MNFHRHSNRLIPAIAVASMLSGAAHAAIIQTSQVFTTNPPVADEYEYANTSSWTISGNISVGNGSSNGGRVFIGVRDTSQGINGGHGILTLQGDGDAIADSLLLNGQNGGVLGRLGHVSAGNWLATINVDGGLAVTMGGRAMLYEAGANTINILNGSLNFTTAGFKWQESGSANAFVNHVIGANGSLIVPTVFTDAAGFAAWAQTTGTGVELNDITVSADSGLSLNFANNGSFTTITAVPEPSVFGLMGLAGLALLRRRR